MSLMATRNPYQLGVSLANASPFFPTLREWRFATDFEGGFRFIEAKALPTGEKFETQREYTFNELATQLLGFVEPIRLLSAQELAEKGLGAGWGIREDLEPSEVVEFLNRFGQIGLGDYLRQAKLQRPHTLDKGELTPEQALSILGIRQKALPRMKKIFKEEPNKWRLMIRKIQSGDLIPFAWVEKDFLDLAKCVRILLTLDRNYREGENYWSLPTTHSRRLRRFLVASELVFVPSGRDEEYRELDKFWLVNNRTIEAEWEKFAFNLNRFLLPITFNAVKREIGSENLQKFLGIETWLAYEVLKSRASLSDKRCERKDCQKQFVALKSTKRYCSDTCSGVERNRKVREQKRKKNSSGKSQKKTKAKGKKINAKT